MSSELQAIIGLIIGVVILVFLVVRTKVHAFPALIIAASIVGLAGGLAPADVAEAITAGFGDTLAVIGLVIGFAVMLGKILEAAGASEPRSAWPIAFYAYSDAVGKNLPWRSPATWCPYPFS